MRFRCTILALAALGATGCQHTQYDWGTYEMSVFRMYSSHESFSVGKEIDTLQREVDRTQRRGLLIPPGKMAHLGYLYLLAGDGERARECLDVERRLFPECEHFMDFLLARLQ